MLLSNPALFICALRYPINNSGIKSTSIFWVKRDSHCWKPERIENKNHQVLKFLQSGSAKKPIFVRLKHQNTKNR
ncbi:MAG: hypothetical protein B6D64_03935 [Bacteroidetes bacterium 4484_276]|nr:MAG: hypothetical protein B6D64_03935 [Bacteroidetes bacterium 4484_276]